MPRTSVFTQTCERFPICDDKITENDLCVIKNYWHKLLKEVTKGNYKYGQFAKQWKHHVFSILKSFDSESRSQWPETNIYTEAKSAYCH